MLSASTAHVCRSGIGKNIRLDLAVFCPLRRGWWCWVDRGADTRGGMRVCGVYTPWMPLWPGKEICQHIPTTRYAFDPEVQTQLIHQGWRTWTSAWGVSRPLMAQAPDHRDTVGGIGELGVSEGLVPMGYRQLQTVDVPCALCAEQQKKWKVNHNILMNRSRTGQGTARKEGEKATIVVDKQCVNNTLQVVQTLPNRVPQGSNTQQGFPRQGGSGGQGQSLQQEHATIWQ